MNEKKGGQATQAGVEPATNIEHFGHLNREISNDRMNDVKSSSVNIYYSVFEHNK